MAPTAALQTPAQTAAPDGRPPESRPPAPEPAPRSRLFDGDGAPEVALLRAVSAGLPGAPSIDLPSPPGDRPADPSSGEAGPAAAPPEPAALDAGPDSSPVGPAAAVAGPEVSLPGADTDALPESGGADADRAAADDDPGPAEIPSEGGSSADAAGAGPTGPTASELASTAAAEEEEVTAPRPALTEPSPPAGPPLALALAAGPDGAFDVDSLVEAAVAALEERPRAIDLTLESGSPAAYAALRQFQALVDAPLSVRASPDVLRELAESVLRFPITLAPAAPSAAGPSAAEPPAAETASLEPPEDPLARSDRAMLVVARTLRSGMAVRGREDVLVYGDVNAGAHIEAGGNIVVLGALRGLAHAGCNGDESAVIISLDLRPAQVRIGEKITFLPQPRTRVSGPEIASVQGNEVVVREYKGKLPG